MRRRPTLNGKGKTDILLRIGDRNVMVTPSRTSWPSGSWSAPAQQGNERGQFVVVEQGGSAPTPPHKHIDLKEEFVRRKSEANGIPPAFQHLHAHAVDAEAAAQALREDNDRLRERVAVYAQVIHELRTELDQRTDNNTQRSPVRSLPTSIT
ncbi:hypothetical protein ACWDBO_35385 [Streptomyces mirabilis]